MSSRGKILVVDDSDLALEWARAQLERAGFEVVTRDEPLGSSLLIIREKPDLVLIDVSMPSLRGDELVTLLKGHTRMHNASLVLYSDRPEDELIELADRSGADGYICKTADVERFLTQIEHFFRLQLLQRQGSDLGGPRSALGK